MLRWLTAGESHGPSLVAILEGLPAHVRVTPHDIAHALARRPLGWICTGFGRTFVRAAERSKGGLIKIGQLGSLRSDLVPHEMWIATRYDEPFVD